MFSCPRTHGERWLVALVLASVALPALADSVFIGSLERKDVKITAVRDGAIELSIDGRAVEPMPLNKITRINIADEPELGRAEGAYLAQQPLQAVEAYQAAFKTTKRPWLKDYILPRLLDSANKSGKFDVAVSSYIALVRKDVQAAQKARPTPPEEPVTQLAAAVTELSRASNDATLPKGAKQALQSLLLEVYRAQKDLASATKLGEQILKSGTMDMNDPAAIRLAGDVRIGLARVAMANKEYDKALAQIEGGKELFVETRQQVVALYCLAQAMDGKAGAKPDANAAKDIALAYMRVVAVARLTTQAPHVVESLYRVAQLHELFGDPKGAMATYSDITQTYAEQPLGKAAAKDVARLEQQLKTD